MVFKCLAVPNHEIINGLFVTSFMVLHPLVIVARYDIKTTSLHC